MVQYKEPVSLADVISRVIEAMTVEARQKNIRIEFAPTPP